MRGLPEGSSVGIVSAALVCSFIAAIVVWLLSSAGPLHARIGWVVVSLFLSFYFCCVAIICIGLAVRNWGTWRRGI